MENKIIVQEKIKKVDFNDMEQSSYNIPYEKLIEEITLKDDVTNKYNEIFCNLNCGYDGEDINLTYYGSRLETDEEYKIRQEKIKNNIEKKKKAKQTQAEKEIATIKTLMRKNKLTEIKLEMDSENAQQEN